MIFAILTCIAVVSLGCSWFLYKRNIEMFLCLLIAVYSEFFYLLPHFFGYKYLLLPILLVLLFESFLNGRLAMGRYGWLVIWFIAISLFGVIVALFYGQSLALSIKAAKFIPLVMVYFLLAGRKIDTDKFALYFIYMSLAVALLATITSFSHGAVNFFPGMPTDKLAEQTVRLRITAGQFVIAAAVVMAFSLYQQKEKSIYLIAFIALFAEVLLVQQTRGFIIAIFLSIFSIYFLSKKLTPMRISLCLIVLACCLGLLFVLSTADFSKIEFIKRIQTDMVKRGGRYGGSLQARLNAYEYYWKIVKKVPFTGRGLLNFNWEGNPDKHMQLNYHIHLSDVGIFHFLIEAGVIGFIWLIFCFFRVWRDIFAFREQLAITCYFIVGTFCSLTLDMFLGYDSLFLSSVFLGVSSSSINMPVKHAAISSNGI
ncbi:membrane hypothetical protein [uncultured Desulfobacterium sp.]|uniref:O-antigen ligase-related domain-containing protein n=1 Tax=uncultured Desulfobacterium sp. TaxID=201089 RepID=A0A445MUX8_9BACT|nr:membrane hypothetical protein [uncultured Desulfobacterium sp.]